MKVCYLLHWCDLFWYFSLSFSTEGLSGFLPVHPTTYIWARRARNKAEAIARMAEEAEREARETEETIKEDNS